MGLDGPRLLLSVHDHFCFDPLCLYVPVVSRICFHHDARFILMSELPFFSCTPVARMPVDPNTQGPEATDAPVPLPYITASRILALRRS
jgi:hypothetical protein